ncbi:DinB family protein [Ornithinimicrobium cryptoxanthini]|uniref:DinB family protein n=1 Tax=Ornithinimicrobium cryptoxanthini TaxID=2934161 RepID=UPI002117A410|nr:DinB family protein [Ornithinimicrobium cryptoxanthini]
MATFDRSDDLRGAQFEGADLSEARFSATRLQQARFVNSTLRGASFVGSDLSGVVVRGGDVQGAEIESPWLFDGDDPLLVNGVNVIPLVDAELNRRFPGRAERGATDPEGLRTAWAALESTWASVVDRVAAMPEGTTDVSVAGEWSFAQTLRHLVMAIDTWLGRAILGQDQPYHPIGQPNDDYAADGHDPAVFATRAPAYSEVLEVWGAKMTAVRNFLAAVTRDELAATRQNPWAPDHAETVLSCLHTILDESWEHYRYALRDLDAIEAGRSG